MTQNSVHTLLPLLLTAALRSLLMGVVLLAAHHVMQLRHIRTQRATWIVALLAALAMPALPTWHGLPRQTQQTPTTVTTRPALPADALTAAPSLTTEATHLHTFAATPTIPLPSLTRLAHHALTPAGSSQTYSRIFRRILLAYGLVAALLTLRLATSLLLALRLRNRAQRLPLHTTDTRISPDLSTPVTIASTILLPPAAATWPDAKLRIVLAHETAHVHQHDFYLKLLSGLHCALFWFSPFPWWLHHRLANLSEALSDHAALALAPSRATYAQLLLEFALAQHTPLAGVAMARPGNLRPRIERLLSDQLFRQAFTGSRLQSTIAAALLPVALLASTSLIHVQAAEQTPSPNLTPRSAELPQQTPSLALAASFAPSPSAAAANRPEPVIPAPAIPSSTIPAVTIRSITLPAIAAVTIPSLKIPAIPAITIPTLTIPAIPPVGDQSEHQTTGSAAPKDEELHLHTHGDTTNINSSSSFASVNEDDSFALITGKGHDVDLWGSRDKAFRDLRQRTPGDLLYFRRGQQAYFSQDPSLIDQAKALYAPMQTLGRHQQDLGQKQEALGSRQQTLARQTEQIHIPTPDLTHELADLQNAAAEIRQIQAKGDLDPAKLNDLQSRIGQIQGKLGELQGLAAAQQHRFGSQQELLGGEQRQLGEQQRHMGEEQSRLAHQAQQQLKPLLDQAIRDGKAQPLH